MTEICYAKRRKYKYILLKDYGVKLNIIVKKAKTDGLIRITRDGVLIFKVGYAWDGPSGPTVDTDSFMRGSLEHDGLYQLIREGFIHNNQRKIADKILKKSCLEDGMNRIRAEWVYWGVRLGGKSSTLPNIQYAGS